MKVTPMPLTVANLATLQEWQTKLTEYIDTHGKVKLGQMISEMYSNDSAFQKLVDDAVASEGKFTQEQLTNWVQSNMVQAAKLDRMLKTLPATTSGLLLGIDCMKATVDKTQMTQEELTLFTSDEYWNTVSIDEVQQYCSMIIDLI